MTRTTDFLINYRRIIKLYDSMLKEICVKYDLSLIEATIISFLYNNPGKDTAGDIVELRMLSKGNVSSAVESLIQKSLLARSPDTADRRRIHLSLLPASKPITDEINTIRNQFHEDIFADFSEAEREQFDLLNTRLIKNTKNAAKRRSQKGQTSNKQPERGDFK